MKIDSGFTLLEVVVTVTILVLLASMALPVSAALVRAGKDDATRLRLSRLATATTSYFEDVGSFPTKIDQLATNPKVAGWAGPYASPEEETDAYGGTITLAAATATSIEVRSPGADHTAGSSDDLKLDVNVLPSLRATSRLRLDAFNAAVVAYNRNRTDPEPFLSGNVATAFATLVGAGYLPNDTTLLRDAWGDPVIAQPPGQTPLVAVGSSNMGAGGT